MRATSLFAIIGIVASLAACIPPPAPTPPINSLAFQKRQPLPGQPGYLETIKYIGDGLHYILPNSDFYVSVVGDLCFRGIVTPEVTPAYIPTNFWCMSPFAVGRVDSIENNISYINQVRLWCRLAAPQCAYQIGYPNMLENTRIANSITTETVPFIRQREAIEHLVYLMGGNTEHDQAVQ